MQTALAATLYGPKDLRVEERPLAPLAPGAVRLRFGAGGICGSDIHYFQHGRTGNYVVTEPLVLGHEIAGEVVDIAGAAPGLQVGDRVAVNPSRWCGACAYCRAGRENLCENIFFMGSASKTPHMQGGFASFIDVAATQCVKVPQHVPFAAAALAEPLAVALHAVVRGGELQGRRVAVFGGGPIGLLVMLAAKLAGAGSVTVVDLAAAPLAMAARLGADKVVDISGGDADLQAAAAGDGYEVVFEATGAVAGLASALAAVQRGGTLVQVGNLPGGSIAVPASVVTAKELSVHGTFRFGREYAQAVDLIATGQVDVLRLVTARMRLAEAPAALALAQDRSTSIKVVLTGD